ncbi:MAG: septum formation inhibitor Maf, partial [Flavobacteriaceae bacterium]|nr:septum formation inhibitor Maf [Flavobacteriaceae bacterium]
DRVLTEEFKNEWYQGDAEITTYSLSQERYGELREGSATMIFVTESMNPDLQVKADMQTEESIPVLKLNMTKKFVTGIYPYSIMTSVFSPTLHQGHALKVSHSVQEWCGQVYAQVNNRNRFEVISHSYFESENDEKFTLPTTWLEDELWNRIRINPNELPTGELEVIPSLEFARLRHVDLQAYLATGTLEQRDSISTYELSYPELKRKLTIHFSSTFPFHIERWEETHANGMQTTARVKKRIRTPYWKQNRLEDESLRDTLGLE